MSLINIEYGSLASSEVMNKNFLYLDDKIAESNNSIMTSISSILSRLSLGGLENFKIAPSVWSPMTWESLMTALLHKLPIKCVFSSFVKKDSRKKKRTSSPKLSKLWFCF